jgi:hypothetical protein
MKKQKKKMKNLQRGGEIRKRYRYRNRIFKFFYRYCRGPELENIILGPLGF